MAELDSRIIAGFEPQKINTPFENLDIVLRSKANQQKVRSNELELRQQTQDAEDRDAIRSIAQQYGNDPETMLQKITERNPVLGMKMRTDLQQAAITNMDLHQKEMEYERAKTDNLLRYAGGLQKGQTDVWLKRRAELIAADPKLDAMAPQQLETDEDMAQYGTLMEKGLTASEQLKRQEARLAILRDDARMKADKEEQARHNKALETAAQSTAERLGGTAEETRRHNQAMEAIGRARANRPSGAGAAQASANRDDAQEIADAIVRGEQPPETTGMYRIAPLVKSALAKQGYNQAGAISDWRATQRHLATMNGTQQTRLAQNVDNAAHSLDIIDDLAKQWDAGRFPPLNRAQLAVAKNGVLGKEAQALATKLEGQITDVTAELANVYMGGNSPTDHALDLAAKNLSADWSRDQLQAMIKQARGNLQIRANSMKNVGVAGASPNNPYAAPGQQEIQGSPKGETVIEYVRDPKTGKLVRK